MNNELLLEYFKVMHRDLNNFEFKLDSKSAIYVPLLSSAIEHCMSIYFLQKEYLTSSMYALVRPAMENYLRAMWVKHSIGDIATDAELSSMHFPKKVEYLIEQVDRDVPEFNQCNFLQTRLGPLVSNIHDFTHGGIQSIARQYTDGDMLTNMRDEGEIKSILKLVVLLSSLAYSEIVQDNVGDHVLKPNEISKLASELIEL
ncbi:DUF6988 family protein [Vibrio metschnikovii]|uniref:DUF6988 family protein n=1 Tax=Vibrio metschnikovii TaxID=28172 RepID=UPI0027DF5041|nr:hypothetical protein [Vibrio metschnikovii]